MDILNFISWIKGGRVSTTIPTNSLIPLALKDGRRDDAYLTTAISGANLISSVAAAIGAATQGPQGPQGPQGVQGITGSQGLQGITGSQGAQGNQGVAGIQGIQGTTGAVGPAGLNWQGAWSALGTYVIDDAVGFAGASWFCIANVGPTATTPSSDPTKWALLASQGAVGPQGSQGIQGNQGIAGPIGLTGLQGTAGVAGANGIQGPLGPIGLTGATGPQGIQGAQGAQGQVGPAGLTWVGTWSAIGVYALNDAVSFGGNSYFCFNPAGVGPSAVDPATDTANWALLSAQGATGPAGANGIAGAVGATGPQGPQGIVGPAGATGPQGATGATGATGLAGSTGAQGVAGPIGPAGLTWLGNWSALGTYLENDAVSFGGASYFCYNPAGVGPSATDPSVDTANWALLAAVGATGPQGPAGTPGIAGATGSTGATGPVGPAGATGPQGIQGIQGPAGASFSVVNIDTFPPVPTPVPWTVDVIQIPTLTYNSFSEIVLTLTGQLSKIGTDDQFTYSIWLTNLPQFPNSPFDSLNDPVLLAFAKSNSANQRTVKLEKSFVIKGDDVLILNPTGVGAGAVSNTDATLLATQTYYSTEYFDGIPHLASSIHLLPIDWTLNWYIVSTIQTASSIDQVSYRWLSLK